MGDNQGETTKDAGKTEKTVKYRVKTTCYWNDRLYHADSVVELPESVKPPVGDNGHFVKLD